VDAEAAATQGRVEELERQYAARVAREQAAADAAEAAASPAAPKNLSTPPQP
jgi:hypothetical protein